MSKLVLNRRGFLKGVLGGATISIGLPPLEAMFNAHGDALAQGAPIPKRFGVWFWGNGIRRAHWTPNGTGLNWTPRAEMAPLTSYPGLKEYISPVTGMEIKTATHPHHSGMTGIMTGARYHEVGPVRDTIISTFAYPSIDQVVAERWAADAATRAPYRSLEIGVCRFRGTDEGTTFQHLSHNGPNNVNASEYEPSRVFNRLFGAPLSAQRNAARQSILDAVKGDVLALKNRVGRGDKLRLDQHLDSIRSIEMRLATNPAFCATPPRPPDTYPDDGQEPIADKNQMMSDLIAMALACDLTRVFSVLFSTAGAGTVFWMVGARNGLHQIAHDERVVDGPELQPTLHAATTFTMEQLAYFLNRLKSTPEGAGNLLDSCAIFCTTELSEGYTHTNDEFPIIVAGRAGGALKGGYHYRSTSKENTSRVLLTLLRAVGDPRTSFGVGAGETSTVISDLLV